MFQFVPEQTFILHRILFLKLLLACLSTARASSNSETFLAVPHCTVPRVRPLAFPTWQRARIRTDMSGLDDLPLQRHKLSQT